MTGEAMDGWAKRVQWLSRIWRNDIVTEEFKTEDSGKRVEFTGGMVRDTDEGKTNWALVADGPMLRRWAELLTRGAKKYDKRNWMRACDETARERARESAFRHFMQWYNGDTGEDHAAAVFFNINEVEYIDFQRATVPSFVPAAPGPGHIFVAPGQWIPDPRGGFPRD